MKKLKMVVMSALAATFLFAGVALAVDPATTTTHKAFNQISGPTDVARLHGDFSTNSSGCAGCHITHSASVAKLLRYGTNSSTFCTYCHGSGSAASPYDVENGKILGENDPTTWAGTVQASTSGGFTKSPYWNGATTDFVTSDSMHDVATLAGGAENGETIIPGGTANLSAGLRCASCHNPHKGGVLDRLLKDDLTQNGTASAPTITVDGGTNTTTAYAAGVSKWCGACHDKFKVGQNAGHDKGADTMYRHAMNVAVATDTGKNFGIATGTPLEGGNIMCLTCHRAHGSAAVMTGAATDYTPGQGTNVGNHSALLRMDNRDVCYNCHLEASNNKPGVGVRQAMN